MRMPLLAVILLTASFAAMISCDRADMHNFATHRPAVQGIYIFSAGPTMGNMGGRLGADAICRNTLFYFHNFAGTTRAFLSASPLEPIINTVPSDYWQKPVYGINPAGGMALLSESWLGLFEKGPNIPIENAIGISGMWWSGSLATGYHELGQDCNGWTDDTVTGESGNLTVALDFTWITASVMGCNNPYYLLCVAY